MRWILGLVAAVSLAGCSLFTQGPPSNLAANQFPRCDDDSVFPAIDTSWAVLYLLSGALIAAEEDGEEVQGALLVTGIGAAIFGGAAWHGFNKARRCAEAKDAYRARYEQVQRQRQELAPPPSSLPLGPPSTVPGGPPGGAP
jgi:hypothetical protein